MNRLVSRIRSRFRRTGELPEFGVFNGQPIRTRAVEELFEAFDFSATIETGTWTGTTTGFLATLSPAPVWSIERNRRVLKVARKRLRQVKGVTLVHADSREGLGRLAADARVPHERVFFYLDAHWGADLPLAEELEIIDGTWRDSIVLIDDFEVPGDPGYGFDDYGEGRRVALDALPDGVRKTWAIWFPAARSSDEGGHRRGWVVLDQSGLIDEALAARVGLRPAD